MTTATSGRSSLLPFAYYDPDSSSLRTSQGTFLSDSMSSSVTLPRSGSMRNGACYQRAPLGLATDVSVCSSWLPTPVVPNGGRQIDVAKYEQRGTSLYRADGSKQQTYLHTVVEQLLPTPAVNDMGEGKTPEAWDEWTDRMKAKHSNGNGHGRSLAIEAARLLPTPTVGDSKSACNSTASRSKEPPTGVHAGDTLTDVARMLPTPTSRDWKGENQRRDETCLPGAVRGATTSTPSDDMSTPSDDQLRLL